MGTKVDRELLDSDGIEKARRYARHRLTVINCCGTPNHKPYPEKLSMVELSYIVSIWHYLWNGLTKPRFAVWSTSTAWV